MGVAVQRITGLLRFEDARDSQVISDLPRYGHLSLSTEEIKGALKRSDSLIKKSGSTLFRCFKKR
jgi:hypothetical protein